MHPPKDKLDELVRRVVDASHPLRIVLFGSAARGEMTADSDLDVLVVVPDGTHRRRTAMVLYDRLSGFGVPVEFVVATVGDLDRYSGVPGLVYGAAVANGRELYAA
jgi:predicted nucleotidyltransferase